MKMINEKKIKKEMEQLGKYLDTRKMNYLEVKLLLQEHLDYIKANVKWVTRK